jgi:hypothetical protein
MKKKELREEINRRLSDGELKTAVFNEMSGKGVSDRVVAYMIASYADPRICDQFKGLTKAMTIIAWIQCVIAALIGIGLGAKHGLIPTLLIAGFLVGFGYLFVWGFKNNRAWAYNATIILSVVNLPKQLTGFGHAPVANTVALLVGVSLIAFTWHVRSKIFPDFAFSSPKKVRGAYVFSN